MLNKVKAIIAGLYFTETGRNKTKGKKQEKPEEIGRNRMEYTPKVTKSSQKGDQKDTSHQKVTKRSTKEH